jgi:glycine dehydrogenase subunit 2
MSILAQSQTGRTAKAQIPPSLHQNKYFSIPENCLRKKKVFLPEVSELQVVRHFTRESQKNFSIDTNFYPLGSCTMKYNPRGIHHLASLSHFLNQHPLVLEESSQGTLHCLYEFQEILKTITGMCGVSLTPMAGAQGEFAGVAMIKAYHTIRNDPARTEFLIPAAAHGTNPASAVMCGYKVREIPTNIEGDINLEALQTAVGHHTAGIMLTNPSTLGVFERQIEQIAHIIHQAGGLLYYDGANLNAILGKVRPGDMGFDVMHLNLHKTFATPHGGGGPGAGPVAVREHLLPFLPIPIVAYENNQYRWLNLKDRPHSIGRLSTFMGNTGILLRAYIYARLLGREGLKRVSKFATLNANYLLKRLQQIGYIPAFPQRRASHEFILTLKALSKQFNVTAMDVGKRLLDFGFHAPTTYFPLLVPECLLIEPTETEAKQELDKFVMAMEKILIEAKKNPTVLNNAPHHLTHQRLDDVKAVKELDLTGKIN